MNLSRRSFFKAIPAALLIPSIAPGEDLFMPVYEPVIEEPKSYIEEYFLRFDFWPVNSYPRLRDRKTLERHYRPEVELDFSRHHGIDVKGEFLRDFIGRCGYGLYQVTEGVVLNNHRREQTGQFRIFYDGKNHWQFPLENWIIRAVHDFDVRTRAGKVIQDELDDKIIEFLIGER